MKEELFIIIFLVASVTMYAQVTAGQIDDFEDGTTKSWFDASATSPVNVNTDGPNGANDNYLRDIATGTSGSGGRMIIRNLATWQGNYTSEGIIAIKFDVRAVGSDINMRVSVNGSGGKFSSNSFTTVTDGSGWNLVVIPISAADMISVSDGNTGTAGFDINATLADVLELRILSNINPAFIGEFVNGEMHLDNITASTTLSVASFDSNPEFTITPNPAKDRLNIFLPSLFENATFTVFDVLGKKIYSGEINNLQSSVNVSNWNNGVYLVRISTNNTTQTKRFIKQ